MLFRVARELTVEPLDEMVGADPVVIEPGEVVRLIPEFARQSTAHVMWKDRCYTVDRSVFLGCTSPLGPAPD